MRRLLFAPTYPAAVAYAQAEGWLNNSWKWIRDLGDVIGLPKDQPVVVLPGAERHPHHAEIRRALERRPVRITYIPAPSPRMSACP